ncbi:NAD(P)-binding protein [Rhizodiscina lignyota]|uniref:NAD(P)-binding protein n=1 Tax=Rhizodiscina lignyota TaxID=1504668 RepID=A0A9P4I6E4_9PEZI|nr:NAD(P)-binding protein [Rhizodiscina lignyota]
MTSHSEFGLETSGLDVAKTFANQIQGRNVVITGVSPNGIGEGTAIAFASQKPKTLILASRTRSKVEDVASNIHSKYPDVDVRIVIVDMSSQESVHQAASEISSMISTLDILINNAGVVIQDRRWTPEKIELQFATNHVCPFLFTNLLMPLLLKAAKESDTPGATRIVTLSSAGHRLSPIRFHDYNFEGHPIPPEEEHIKDLPPAFVKARDGYPGFIAYGHSKTANILFALYLQEHLRDMGIMSYTLHPGGVSTDMSRNLDEEGAEAINRTSKYWKTPDQGSSTTLVAALDPALNNPVGLFLDNCQFKEPAAHATNPDAARRLWALSEELVGAKFTLGSKL